MGLYSFNLFATSQDQPTHVNGYGGAFHKVLEIILNISTHLHMYSSTSLYVSLILPVHVS